MEDGEVCIGETELIIKLRPRLPCCQFLYLFIEAIDSHNVFKTSSGIYSGINVTV